VNSFILPLIIIRFLLIGLQIIEGIATVAVGILAAFLLVDYPANAAFLTPEERAYIVWKMSEDLSSRRVLYIHP
jgi:hypothetical protein